MPISIDVMPMASIDFPDGTAGLHLYVPPATNTIPDVGVQFVVEGNAMAWVTGTPAEFLHVQSYIVGTTNHGPRYLGRAVRAGGGEIGYNIAVEFPVGFYSFLPGGNGQGTPANPVNMPFAGGAVTGYLHLIASHRWTPTGLMPDVGDYTGEVVVTVSAGP